MLKDNIILPDTKTATNIGANMLPKGVSLQGPKLIA